LQDVAEMTGYSITTISTWRQQFAVRVESARTTSRGSDATSDATAVGAVPHEFGRSAKREQKRDAKARECGYRNWEHLIRATRNEPYDDVAEMTGYSVSTISTWRQHLSVRGERRDGITLQHFAPSVTEQDRRVRRVERGCDDESRNTQV
jgi:transposase